MSSTLRPIPLAAVEYIFDWMTRRYGSVFLDMWAANDHQEVKVAWSEDLAGYTKEELQTGLKACRMRSYPPTLPLFMQLCRPPIDYESAFCEAAKQMALRATGLAEWPSPAIYWAAVKIGAFDMRNGTWATMKKRWTAVLDEMLMTPNLPPVPDRVPALPEPARTIIKESGLKAYVESLQTDRSGRTWAQVIFSRYASGEEIAESVLLSAEAILDAPRPKVEIAA